MIVGDIFDVYKGEIRVYNRFYDVDVGIVNTEYNTWVKNSYRNCEVEKIELEMLNTAVLSSRIVITIFDEGAGQDSGDVEEATRKDIDDLINSIYEDSDDNGKTEDEETIRVITQDYYDHDPLPGDEEDCFVGEASDKEIDDLIENSHSDNPEEDTSEATQEDIDNLLGGIYQDE